jgi:hypothetical protein
VAGVTPPGHDSRAGTPSVVRKTIQQGPRSTAGRRSGALANVGRRRIRTGAAPDYDAPRSSWHVHLEEVSCSPKKAHGLSDRPARSSPGLCSKECKSSSETHIRGKSS